MAPTTLGKSKKWNKRWRITLYLTLQVRYFVFPHFSCNFSKTGYSLVFVFNESFIQAYFWHFSQLRLWTILMIIWTWDRGRGHSNKALPPSTSRPVPPLALAYMRAVTQGGSMMKADGWDGREGRIWQIIPCLNLCNNKRKCLSPIFLSHYKKINK